MKRKPYKKVTLVDVAREANVSATTVSRVINKPELVDEETRGKILDVMKEINYVHLKNPAAQTSKSVLSGKRGIITLIIPNDDNPYYSTLISFVEKRLEKAGYLMTLSVFNNDADNIEDYLRVYLDQKIDGCIMTYIRPDNRSDLFSKYIKCIPTISFQSDIDNIDSVIAEEYTGTFEMLEQLIKFGHRKIGFVGYFSNMTSYVLRVKAYRDVHEKYNIPLRDEYIIEYEGETGIEYDISYREGCKLLSLQDRPTAIFCFNVKTAIGIYSAIRDYKLKVPDDISLCAFDELQINQLFTPPLTAVGIPMEAMVDTAVEMLISRIEKGNNKPVQRVNFPTTFYMRSSIVMNKKV